MQYGAYFTPVGIFRVRADRRADLRRRSTGSSSTRSSAARRRSSRCWRSSRTRMVITALGVALGAPDHVHARARCHRRARSTSARWCRCSSENSFLVQFLGVISRLQRLGHRRDRDRPRRALPRKSGDIVDRAARHLRGSFAVRRRRMFFRAGNLNDAKEEDSHRPRRRRRPRRDRLRQPRRSRARPASTVTVEKIEQRDLEVDRLGQRQDPAEAARSTSAPRRWARSSSSTVREGDVVKKGQLLLQIDPKQPRDARCRTARRASRPRESQLEQTKAQIENAQASRSSRRRTTLKRAGSACARPASFRASTTSGRRTT